MEGLKDFFSVDKNACGRGCGGGVGSGCGNGIDDGYGSGDKYGIGRGSGSGNGSGNEDGNGAGNGAGNGDGDGYINGNGFGDGFTCDDIKSINNQPVYMIDEVPTLIDKIRGSVAKGKIINKDLTTTKCYVVKVNNLFAHGKTLKEAKEELYNKVILNKPIEERISDFKKRFKFGKKYKARDFYEWHYRLTGSCSLGRDSFVKDNGINLDTDKFTVEEFIERTKDVYGGDIVSKLK